MKNPLILAAALVLTGLGTHAQGTKPAPKNTKMETKSEEKMESKKEEAMENGKSGKPARHGAKMSRGKRTPKSNM